MSTYFRVIVDTPMGAGPATPGSPQGGGTYHHSTWSENFYWIR